MASPLTVKRNDYRKNRKSSTIYTPVGVAEFLYKILRRPYFKRILDPAIGSGRLTDPWLQLPFPREIIGVDIIPRRACCHKYFRGRFEEMWELPKPDLVLSNPPFNSAPGRGLYPEIFLKHIFEMYGPTMPAVMFTPMGMLLNQRKKSTRWRWLRDCGAQITSIVSMPLDIFPGVEFHNEIVTFNVTDVQPHFFLPEEALN
jgi:type I restriction-modification system DNA methylase subunit